MIRDLSHTLPILPNRRSPVVVSKREIAMEEKTYGPSNTPETSKETVSNNETNEPTLPNFGNLPNSLNLPNSEELPEEAEVNTQEMKKVRMESSSNEEQDGIEQVEKTPVAKEKAQSPRKGGRTRSGRAVKKPKWPGHNVMVSAIKKPRER